MRAPVLSVVAAALLAGGAVGVLSACSGSQAADPPVAPATHPADAPAELPITPQTPAQRAPLGLEVRYIDENGKFVTVAPEDFRR